MSVNCNYKIQKFIDHIANEKRYSSYTVNAYTNDIKQFVNHASSLGYKNINDLDSSSIKDWIVTLSESNYSSASIARKISVIKTYLKYLTIYEGVNIKSTLIVRTPKKPKRSATYITQKDLHKALSESNISSNDYNYILAKAILEFLYATGIRLSELINIEQKNIDFYKKEVKIIGKGDKERRIPLTDHIISIVKSYCIEKSKISDFQNTNYLFVSKSGQQMYPMLVRRLIKVSLLSISHNNKTNPHVIRHSFATHLLNNGANLNHIKELLGHESLSTTQKYTHNTIDILQKIHKNHHPRNK